MIPEKNRGENSPENIVTVADAVTFQIDNGRDQAGNRIPPKHQAELAGISERRFRKIQGGFTELRTGETARFCKGTGWRLVVDLIERDLGCVGVPLPILGADRGAGMSIEKAPQVLREMAQFIEEISKTRRTPEHAARVRKEANDVHVVVEAIAQQVEAELRGQR